MEKSIYSIQHECLIKLLRQTRIEKKLTQVGLARKIKQPQSFVSKYESGERRIDLVELRFICKALEISTDDFLKRFEEEITPYESE